MTAHALTRPWRPLTGARGTVARAGALAALAAIPAACLALVLATSERPSVLAPSSQWGAFPRWLAGPLAGHLPALTNDPLVLRADLTILLGVLFALWLVALAAAGRTGPRATMAAVAAAYAVLALGPPTPLTDLFNYLHYGRMLTDGLNPYTHPPLADPWAPGYLWSNWNHLPSPYGPLFTLLGAAVSPLGLVASYWTLKALTVAAWLGVVALVRRASPEPARATVLVGLNPLVLVYAVGGFHNDGFALLGLVAALTVSRASSGGAAAVAATAVKATAGALAPVLILGRRRWSAGGGAAAAAAIAAAVVAGVFGGALPADRLQSRLVTPLSVPNLAGALLGRGGADQTVRTVAQGLLALAVAVACVAVLRGARTARAGGWVAVAIVLTLAWVMPWYVAWVLPFAALARSRALTAGAIALTLWLGLTASPLGMDAAHALGYYPLRTAVGAANHAYTERLLK